MKTYIPTVESAGVSITGPVREENQDSIHLANATASAEGLLFAIADGMGGYAHGGVASLLALQTLAGAITARQNNVSISKTLRSGIEKANLQVYQKAQQLSAGRMGTTLTAAYVTGNTLHLAHIGDSRAYLIRNRQAICLSMDHTTVGDMVRNKLIAPEKLRTHAQRSVLTRAIGIGLFVQPDITEHRLQAGDYLILCSDGVWSVIQDEDFARAVEHSDSMEAIGQKLIEWALQNETDDNASVVVIRIAELTLTAAASQSGKSQTWLNYLRKWVS